MSWSRALLKVLCVVVMALSLTGCKKPADDMPALGTIGEFSLQDQNGKRFTAADLRGKVWVADFIFTRCPSACPRMTRYMKALQDDAKSQNVSLQFVSFSVDPENDTPQALLAFAKQYGADLSNWSFLTGDIEVIKKTSVEGFKMGLEGTADPKKADFGILHGSHLVLVDQKMQIRGYYPTQNEDTHARLLKDAKSLSD